MDVIAALGDFEPTRADAQALFHDVFHDDSPLDAKRRLMLQQAIVKVTDRIL